MSLQDERRQILNLLESGKISADEAIQLFNALEGNDLEGNSPEPALSANGEAAVNFENEKVIAELPTPGSSAPEATQPEAMPEDASADASFDPAKFGWRSWWWRPRR